MNISRIALLSALITAPYAIASETPIQTTETVTPSTLAKLGGFIVAPFVFAGNKSLDTASWIADKTYLEALIAKITTTKHLNDTRLNNPKVIGQVIVLAAATVAAYKAYQAYNAQDFDADEDDVLFYDEDESYNS